MLKTPNYPILQTFGKRLSTDERGKKCIFSDPKNTSEVQDYKELSVGLFWSQVWWLPPVSVLFWGLLFLLMFTNGKLNYRKFKQIFNNFCSWEASQLQDFISEFLASHSSPWLCVFTWSLGVACEQANAVSWAVKLLHLGLEQWSGPHSLLPGHQVSWDCTLTGTFAVAVNFQFFVVFWNVSWESQISLPGWEMQMYSVFWEKK